MDHKASLEDLSADKQNALHLCSMKNNCDIASLVVQEDHSLLNKADLHGNFPHHIAVDHNNREILEFYLQQKQTDISTLNSENLNVIGQAIRKNPALVTAFDLEQMKTLNNLDKLKSFINYHDNLEKINIQTALSYALQHDINNLNTLCTKTCHAIRRLGQRTMPRV